MPPRVTEPDVGSDPARLAATATPVDGTTLLESTSGSSYWLCEHELLPEAIRLIARGAVSFDAANPRRVVISD